MAQDQLIYPSVTFPALPDGVAFGELITYLQNIRASLRPAESLTAYANDASKLKIRYVAAPTVEQGLKEAKTLLNAGVSTGLTASEVVALLDLINSIK